MYMSILEKVRGPTKTEKHQWQSVNIGGREQEAWWQTRKLVAIK